MDKRILEMASVYKISPLNRAIKIYLPLIAPYVLSACSVALGFAWKSGIAGEVIAFSTRTIGGNMHWKMVDWDMAGVLAWTIVIVALSALMDAGLKLLFGLASKRFYRGEGE